MASRPWQFDHSGPNVMIMMIVMMMIMTMVIVTMTIVTMMTMMIIVTMMMKQSGHRWADGGQG